MVVAAFDVVVAAAAVAAVLVAVDMFAVFVLVSHFQHNASDKIVGGARIRIIPHAPSVSTVSPT